MQASILTNPGDVSTFKDAKELLFYCYFYATFFFKEILH